MNTPSENVLTGRNPDEIPLYKAAAAFARFVELADSSEGTVNDSISLNKKIKKDVETDES